MILISNPSQDYKTTDQFNESQSGVLLKRVLPLLRAEQHDELYDGGWGLEGRDGLALHQQVLAVRPDQRLGQERREVNHDLAQQGTDGTWN